MSFLLFNTGENHEESARVLPDTTVGMKLAATLLHRHVHRVGGATENCSIIRIHATGVPVYGEAVMTNFVMRAQDVHDNAETDYYLAITDEQLNQMKQQVLAAPRQSYLVVEADTNVYAAFPDTADDMIQAKKLFYAQAEAVKDENGFGGNYEDEDAADVIDTSFLIKRVTTGGLYNTTRGRWTTHTRLDVHHELMLEVEAENLQVAEVIIDLNHTLKEVDGEISWVNEAERAMYH